MEGEEGVEGRRKREDTFAVKPVLKCTTTVTVSKDSASLWWAVCLISFKDDIDCFNESNCNWHHE